jgi:hypothetical protein
LGGGSNDEARVREIVDWFEQQGFSVYFDEVRGDWFSAWVIPPGVRVGVVPPLFGTTRLAAAENALQAAETGQIAGIVVKDEAGNMTIYAPTATATVSAPARASAPSMVGAFVDADLKVTEDARRALRHREALDRKLGEFGWTLLFTREEPDGAYLWVVADVKTGQVIQHGTGDDWEDSKLTAIMQLYPPSDEGLAG